MRSKAGAYAASVLVVVVAFLAGVGACEVAFRLMDGYPVLPLRLVKPPTAAPVEKSAEGYTASVPLAPGMKAEWYNLSPASAVRRAPDPAILAAVASYVEAGVGPEAVHVFNAEFVQKRLCSEPYFRKFPGFLFLYDGPNGTDRPRYRFPLNAATPGGMTTNQFGWRGPHIELRKPANTIRIAFVGASSTVNDHSYPFSYPELAGFWLNKWAEERLGLKVEVINAGREGIQSFDIAAIVRDEVLALEPDVVIYYEGGNQFSPGSIVRLKGQISPLATNIARQTVAHLDDYSAFARRIAEAANVLGASGAEPAKPPYDVVWPADVDEHDPPLEHPALPSNLSTIIHDLDAIRTTLAVSGGELVLSSYYWIVFDGMKLDPVRHAYQFRYLNNAWYPYRYRDMERVAAFQNRVFKKYAALRGVPFLNVAAAMPRDPDLFYDAVHATYQGVRLHAWIAAQQLAPLLQERVSSGRLPRAYRSELSVHPAFPGNVRTVVFSCTSDFNAANASSRLTFSDGIDAVPPAIVGTGPSLSVRIPAGTTAYRYAAMVALPAREKPQSRGLMLKAQIKVTGGNVGVGILSANQQRFLSYRMIEEADRFVRLNLTSDSEHTGIGPLVIAAGNTPSKDVTVEMRDTEILSMDGPIPSIRTFAPGLAVPPTQ